MQNNLSERFVEFATNIIKLATQAMKTRSGRHIGNQLIRSGTSVGANYEEACGAQSLRDFIHKMQIVLKELKETFYWLRLIKNAAIVSDTEPILSVLLKENQELIKIVAKSVVTAKRNAKGKVKNVK